MVTKYENKKIKDPVKFVRSIGACDTFLTSSAITARL